jgi:DNA repair protein RecO (recombination protein O)
VNQRHKVDGQPAFVLHAYPYSETSLIVDVFSRDHGRVALLARGARRPRSVLRGVLLAFQPLEVGWAGRGEVQTLIKAEWQGGQPLLAGKSLFCGYYLNELLMHLLPREDPMPDFSRSMPRPCAALPRARRSRICAASSARCCRNSVTA